MKTLLSALAVCGIIMGVAANELPRWSPSTGNANCSSCGDGGESGGLQVGTLLKIDLGPGTAARSLGSLSLSGTAASAQLASPAALRVHCPYAGDSSSAEKVQIVRDVSRNLILRQVSTERLFIDIEVSTALQYTIRIMDRQARGDWGNGYYAYDIATHPEYLLKQYVIENPDSTGVSSNQVRVVDATSSSTWLFTYSSALSGWSVNLPENMGSMEIISTNQTSSSWTYIKRLRNSAGTVVSEHSQVFTNYSWGSAMILDTRGVDTAAQTTRWSYYDPSPFSQRASRPLKTVMESDGGWHTVSSYDSQGRILEELYGVDTVVTNDASQCRRITYSYATQDGSNDDLSRYADNFRKREEYWKGQLVERTYRVYSKSTATTQFDKEVRCPNPNNAIGASDNEITVTYYASIGGTTVSRIVNPDGTVAVPSVVDNGDGTFTTTTDVGEPSGTDATQVINGTRREVLTGLGGQEYSRRVWAITSGVVGPLLESVVQGGFDSVGRPTRVDYALDGTYELFSYNCCGLSTVTERSGLSYRLEYDALHRNRGRTILSYNVPLAHTNVLDVAGRVRASVRNGGGQTNVVKELRTYDTADRLVVETNAWLGVTSFSNWVSGALHYQQTVSPGGGTLLETYLADGSLSSRTGSATFGVAYEYGIEYDNSAYRRYTVERKLGTDGAATTEWTKRYQDGLGRVYKEVYAAASGTPTRSWSYNAKGQLEKEVDPDGVTTLYRYNGQGQRIISAVDLDQDGQVADYDGVTGKDRVTRTTTTYLASGASNNTRTRDIRRVGTTVWSTDGASTESKVSTIETSLDGRYSWQIRYRDSGTLVESSTVRVLPTSANGWLETVTETAPDASTSVSISQYDRLLSASRKDSSGNPIGATTYLYDTHGRRTSAVDARANFTTSYTYNDADQVVTQTTSGANELQKPLVTRYYYSALGQLTNTIAPDGGSTFTAYCPNGQVWKTWGSRVYPVAYSYDGAGRVKTMTNWTSYPLTGARVTTWIYNQYRGWLSAKRYPNASDGSPGGLGPDYEYTPGGRLTTRSWARGTSGSQRLVTQYRYGFDDATTGNQHADLTQISYSNDAQSTPTVSYNYDRRGRRTEVSQGGVKVAELTYNDADEPVTETHTGGVLSGLSVQNGYDGCLRRSALRLYSGSSLLSETVYGYDGASRLLSVSESVTNQVSYEYLANSSLVDKINSSQNSQSRMSSTREYDRLSRLSGVSWTPQAGAPLRFAYSYNTAGQRTRLSLRDASYWTYEYDSLGQVQAGRKYWGDGTPVAGQQFEYAFDQIGNRTAAWSGGDGNGGGMRRADYTANGLNQYDSRTNPGGVDVTGVAMATAAVTVQGASAYRKGEYYWREAEVANSSGAVWQLTTVNVSGETNQSGRVFVAARQEAFLYDPDGNLTNDGRWSYRWDAENRLVCMVANQTNPAVGPQERIEFKYDWQGRRISKKVWENVAGTGDAALESRFVYDGWNLVGAFSSSLSLASSYVWGRDLSGSMAGAGGVGGLLIIKDVTNGVHFVAYDGNGNIAGLVRGTDGTSSALYEYGPFGEVIRTTGPMARVNPLRFSTQYTDDETDLVCYLHRYYSPSTGRWLARDPIEENGGLNLYGFVNNATPNYFDLFGLDGTNDPNKPKAACACRCKKVTGGPPEKKIGSRYQDSKGKDPGLQFGLRVPWKVEVEGDISKCHCKYIDKGTIGYTVAFHGEGAPTVTSKPESIDKTKDPIPCSYSADRPGPHFTGTFPSVGSADVAIDYDMTMTLICEDEDKAGTKSDTVTLKGKYSDKDVKWPASK